MTKPAPTPPPPDDDDDEPTEQETQVRKIVREEMTSTLEEFVSKNKPKRQKPPKGNSNIIDFFSGALFGDKDEDD